MRYKDIFPIYEQALDTDTPEESLILLLKELMSQGHTRESLTDSLTAFAFIIYEQDREFEQDLIYEVLDDLTQFKAYPRL